MASTQDEEKNIFLTIDRVKNSLGWKAYGTVQMYEHFHLNCVGGHVGRETVSKLKLK